MSHYNKPDEHWIRWMMRRDLDEVIAIEKACFESPWSEDDFLGYLRNSKCVGMVVEQDKQLLAYAVYELHKGFLNILNIAVRPDRQRTKLGSKLVNKLKATLSETQRAHIETLVRERNLTGQSFFRRHDFRCEEVLRGRWNQGDCPEDAYRFVFRLRPVQTLTHAAVSAGNRISRELQQCQ
jgi:ribosomal-protein-alanine N-acetyltransferase